MPQQRAIWRRRAGQSLFAADGVDDVGAPRRRRRRTLRRRELPGGLTVRALVPNAITSAALCSGLTAIRFAIGGDYRSAALAVILAGLLDGVDGSVARMLRAQSRFGAELDSLSDAIAFGVAPAITLYLWSLAQWPRLGWFAALALALACALRLARFNARIDLVELPHKRAGFLTGVPAPLGAALAFLPVFLWLASGRDDFRAPFPVAVWTSLVAFMMISEMPTPGWGMLRPHRTVRLSVVGAVGLVVTALLTETWYTLAALCFAYLALVPVGLRRFRRLRQLRDGATGEPDPVPPASAPLPQDDRTALSSVPASPVPTPDQPDARPSQP